MANGRQQRFVFEKFAFPDRLADAGQILVNDPSGPDIEMADFRIAHLAFRKPDRLAASGQGRMRISRPVAVKVRLFRLGDGVALRLLAQREAVEND
ncbi:hypothetical protein PACILC2_04440 [Paenibacillus cisolokensis]|uniref:Uncharacterized protein n=1 Tax=Paenibacillus cisolokensis TaxID=1658519 RepID=A0ABQ4N1J9_9BACL|nr:hypothetical protein PACILC2_04440 [Paenibacillus cisolokensis]